nr:hypothetical protein [Thermomonospora curvata]
MRTSSRCIPFNFVEKTSLGPSAEDEVGDRLSSNAYAPTVVTEQHEDGFRFIDGKERVASCDASDRVKLSDGGTADPLEVRPHLLPLEGIQVEFIRSDLLTRLVGPLGHLEPSELGQETSGGCVHAEPTGPAEFFFPGTHVDPPLW